MASAENEANSKRYLDLIALKLLTTGSDRIALNILSPTDAPWQGTDNKISLDIIVELPEKMKIEGQLQFMRLDASGPLKGIDIKASYSAMNIMDINGPVELATSFAAVELTDVNGSVQVENRYGAIKATDITIPVGSGIFQNTGGAITLRDIRGPIEAYTSYSPIEATDIDAPEGSIVFRTSYSPISIQNVSGEIICETSFSPITITDCSLTHGQSRAETNYSPVEAEFEKIGDCQLFIYNNYNNISLILPADLSAQIIATVNEGGKIHTSNIPIRPTYLDASRLEGLIGNGDSRIELKVSGIGVIDIQGR
jgi:hypothetical protein